MNAANSYQSTALILAAQNGHASLVPLLLGAGADPNRSNRDDDTPLHMAASRGPSIVPLLPCVVPLLPGLVPLPPGMVPLVPCVPPLVHLCSTLCSTPSASP